jgi:hypothetical protein
MIIRQKMTNIVSPIANIPKIIFNGNINTDGIIGYASLDIQVLLSSAYAFAPDK